MSIAVNLDLYVADDLLPTCCTAFDDIPRPQKVSCYIIYTGGVSDPDEAVTQKLYQAEMF